MDSAGHLAFAAAVDRNVAFGRKAVQSSYAAYEDPKKPAEAGATGGVKTGGFGFHTDNEFAPWWMLDLGDVHAIGTIRVFNRQDLPERARTLCVSLALSAAGPWIEIYKSAGLFGGVLTGDPLAITLAPRIAARFVRLHLTERNILHVDEVEVYAKPAVESERFFPVEHATMDYPSETDIPGNWEDICNWVLFRNRYAARLGAFLNPAWGQGRPQLTLKGSQGFDGTVKTLRLVRYGRFANNFYQILNGAMLARAMQCTALQIPQIDDAPEALPIRVDSLEIQRFSQELPEGPAITARCFFPAGLEDIVGPYQPAFALDTIERFVKPVYQNFLSPVGSLDAQTMAMHFRGGDVFESERIHRDYVQPPASYYIRALEYGMRRLGITAVHLVYEDKKNPAVDILIAHLTALGITFTEQSASVLNDAVSLMSAHHLVAGYGTFCEAIALLSPVTRSYFAFRRVSSQWMLGDFWPQTRVADLLRAKGVSVLVIDDPDETYIKPQSWENTPEQLQMIHDYPARKLRLMVYAAVDPESPAAADGPGHADVARAEPG